MAEETVENAQTYTFQAEIQQLLRILVHSLYTQKEIFLRELISNASDALNRVQFEMLTNADVLDPEAELGIWIAVDKDARTLTITDTGIGMDRDELIDNLGTIAQSGAARFLKRLQEEAPDSARQMTDLIGQFGVGFYSVFMVAERVRVVSRSARPDATAWAWTSDGSTTYTIEPADKTTRGTEITVFLKEDAEEFLRPYRLREVIKTHSDFIPFPIRLDGEIVNQRTAIWRRPAGELSEDDYRAFYNQLTLDFQDPLLHLHIASDAPVQFYSLLYVPSRANRGILSARTDHGLKLYVRKVLIQQHNKDFLPHYLRFVDGVVDSEDLPLNVARESIQATRMIKRIGASIKGKLLGELEHLAETDPARYLEFWREFGVFLKEGIATEPDDVERLAPLLRFHSTLSDGEQPTVSLRDYVGRMADDQNEIYYVLADDLKSAASSPHLDPFKARGLEVLYMIDTVDSFMLLNLREFDGKRLRNVDDAGLELPQREQAEAASDQPALDDDAFEQVRKRFADVLGERVLEVRASQLLTENPVRLATPEGQLDRNVQRVYRLLEREYHVPQRILELNRRHPLIRNLAAWIREEPDAPIINEAIEQLYAGALLVDGLHPNPAEMVSHIHTFIERATRRS